MTTLVDPTRIEQIVGRKRHSLRHYGRAVSDEHMFSILHSQRCMDRPADLRDCRFSIALDRGIDALAPDAPSHRDIADPQAGCDAVGADHGR
jgi:hypothetical protein